MVKQSGGCSASHPAPRPTTPSLIPQAGGPKAALDRAAKQTNAVTLEWAQTGITSSPTTPGLGTPKGWDRERSGPRHQSKRRIAPLAAAVLHNAPITARAHLSVKEARGSLQKGEVRRKAGGSEAKGESEGGGEDGHAGPCAQESPGPVSAGVLPDFQGGPLFAPTAARAQSREAEWLPLLEVEEPLCVHGALSADWDMGPDMVSPPSKHLSVSTGTPLSIHSPHDVLCECVCQQHLWQSVAARRRRLCSGRVRDVGDGGI